MPGNPAWGIWMEISRAIIIDAEEPLSKAASKIRSSKMGVIVVKDGQYFGMVDEVQLSSSSKDSSKSKVSKIAVKTPVLSPSSTIREMVSAFFAGRFKTLPVISGTKIAGTVSRWDVLSELSSAGLLSGSRVSQYMTSPLITISPSETVGRAKALMRENNIRRLVVVENGRIEGIISFFDLTRLVFAPRHHAPQMRDKVHDDKRTVSSFMRTSIEIIERDATLTEAIGRMLDTKVAALVVTDGLAPLGILTAKDIMEALMRQEGNAKVSVSGLHGFEEDADSAREECLSFVSKTGKSISIDALNMHVKKTGRQYFVSAHVHGKHSLLSSASGWSLMEAVREALYELSVQAGRLKGRRITERKAD